ncbi:hypothetical protein ADIARSV_2187 [Arcticibacter svalbardensis MN12-7]|uniref:Uncharacterized protein n=2 Tax=Arcticibacter TaxID=1288026 RepID=R9H037_9SPHI|nr:hypothetical protein ADIARSV_2187 [Arcticibacter svalbardensis MN12-7]
MAKEIYVSSIGSDKNVGTKVQPFLSFERALLETKKFAGKEPVHVWFLEGDYYLNKTITIGIESSGSLKNPVLFSALPGSKVNIKGSKELKNLKWNAYKNGIYVASVPSGLTFDQVFINGERKVRARFPDYDYENPLRGGNGYQQVIGGTNHRYDKWLSFDSKTFTNKDWKNPETGIVHAFQSHNWGNMQYRVKEVNRTENKLYLGEGGWQLQRDHGIGGSGESASWFFVDNIFEELDTPGEWFLDTKAKLLYYYPQNIQEFKNAKVEVPILKDFIQLIGTKESPVKNISFKGLNFTQSRYTYMDKYEPVARGDWAIHRGGAIFMEGAENCVVEDCNFEYVGGNGVFMSSYNRNNQVKSCRFVHTGESAVCFVGSPSAVRFYQTWDDKEIYGKNWNEMRKNMDLTSGPKTPDYPENCIVENSVMHDIGDVGKQVAGVYISMSHKIVASHNTIYNCPRAGICINDGTWGGHIIEYNDIWETVRETGEHGPFNAWGRERQWSGSRGTDADFMKELTKLDAIDPVIVRNNKIANYRKSISAGNWTIDLDDGSSNYEIYHNLNLGSTIKLRDGMLRKVFNNITVSAVPLGWHVWPKASEDEIYKNIFVISGAIPGNAEPTNSYIRQVGLPTDTKWSTHYDDNLYWNVNAPKNEYIVDKVTFKQWQEKGFDEKSKVADPLFVDPKNGNYQVQANSPALKLGFKNFPMDEFGHEMTRIKPFGGDFSGETKVEVIADKRGGKEADIYFTLDGSEPSIHSQKYKGAINIKNSTLLKAQTFDKNGISIGFVNEANFTKVNEVVYPSWLSTLLTGKYEGQEGKTNKKALEMELEGALLINIADDPDLIDATGGYNYGCYIKSIDPEKGKIWITAQLPADWVIQQVNGNKIQNIAALKKQFEINKGKTIIVTAARDYNFKKFEVKIP